MTNLLKGKNAMVTGAANGIGKAIAGVLAREGANVLICDINMDAAEICSEEIRAYGTNCIAKYLDISNVTKIKPFVEKAEEEFGPIDILVNNAGISMNVSIEDLTENMWDKVMDVNLKGTFFVSQAVFERMKKRHWGRIINIGSLAGERGGRFAGANYSASKGGIITLTKCFALDGGSHGVNTNVICPGLIDTEMARHLGFTSDNTSDIPLGRLGTPEEVANIVMFLASPLADYINGQTISVNGGQTMR